MGFELDPWDYLIFAVIFCSVVDSFCFAFLRGLPGHIAISRRHPEADAGNVMGWLGFLTLVFRIQAFIRAFKPTNRIDLGYFPKEEQQDVHRMLAKLTRNSRSETMLGCNFPVSHGAGTAQGWTSRIPEGGFFQAVVSWWENRKDRFGNNMLETGSSCGPLRWTGDVARRGSRPVFVATSSNVSVLGEPRPVGSRREGRE